MKRAVPSALSVMGLLLLATLVAACGHTPTGNSSGHGLRWESFYGASNTPSTFITGIVSGNLWYNNCTRKVEMYYPVYHPLKHDNDILWFWNGSQWRSIKTVLTFTPSQIDGQYFAWDSNDCRIIMLDSPFTDSLAAADLPGQVLSPTWMFNGKSWNIATPASPGIAMGIVMVYDPSTRTIVLNGKMYYPAKQSGTWPVPKGNARQVVQQINRMGLESIKRPYHPLSFSTTTNTWIFNGRTWIEEHLDNGPPVVNGFSAVYDEGHLAVYDPATRTVVLFGGGTNPMLVNAQSTRKPGAPLFVESKPVYDTWLWNGVTWTKADVKDNPQVDTTYSAMAYDPLLKGVVLYDTQSRTTWLWTGNDWERLRTTNTMSPKARVYPLMVFDVSTGQLILVGGDPQGSHPHRFHHTWVLAGIMH